MSIYIILADIYPFQSRKKPFSKSPATTPRVGIQSSSRQAPEPHIPLPGFDPTSFDNGVDLEPVPSWQEVDIPGHLPDDTVLDDRGESDATDHVDTPDVDVSHYEQLMQQLYDDLDTQTEISILNIPCKFFC